VPDRVETTDPEGVDFAWVMQTTFVVTILVGAPIVALASIPATLPTWEARASFAIRVGAIVWLVVAVGAFLYARRGVEEGRNDHDREAGSGSGNGNEEESGRSRDRDRGDSSDEEDTGPAGESTPSGGPHSPSERSSET
jgi:hypothetical protein